MDAKEATNKSGAGAAYAYVNVYNQLDKVLGEIEDPLRNMLGNHSNWSFSMVVNRVVGDYEKYLGLRKIKK